MLPVGVFAVAQGAANYTVTKKLQREAVTLGAVEASQKEQGEILEAFGILSAISTQLNLDTISECRSVLQAFIENQSPVRFIGYISGGWTNGMLFPDGSRERLQRGNKFSVLDGIAAPVSHRA